MDDRPWEDSERDPEGLLDENNPDVREEMFRTFRHQGMKPDDLVDPDYAAQYAEWLRTVPDEDD